MINPIVEEALTNIVRRLNDIEEFQRKYYERIKPDRKSIVNPLAPTEGQVKYIKALGGSVLNDMTKDQAGIEIDRLLKEKEGREGVIVNEPAEVDTEDAGLEGELL